MTEKQYKEKYSKKDKISDKIRNLLFENENNILIFFSNIGEDKEFFLQIIKRVYLNLKNETDLLNDLNSNQFKKFPYTIYRIAKELFLYNGFILGEKKFIKKLRNFYGFIYLATNALNGKVYVGQTALPRTIEIEWKDLIDQGKRLLKRREKNPLQSRKARHIINAIAKYDVDVWDLKLIDIAYNRVELNKKEINYVMEVYDSMNIEKGYNMTEGGEGTKGYGEKKVPDITQFLIDIKNSTVQKEVLEKYGIDRGTMNKWLDKISGQLHIKNYSTAKKFLQNREINNVVNEFSKLRQGQYSKYLEEIIETPSKSEIAEELWKDESYQKRTNEGQKKLYKTKKFQREASKRQHKIWNSPELRMRQSEKTKSSWETNPEFKKKALEGLEEAHKYRRKALPDIKEFLKTIKNSKSYKDVTRKFNINHPFMQRKIKNVLNPFGIKKYVDAKEFLAQRNIDNIFNELEKAGHIKRLIDLGYFEG